MAKKSNDKIPHDELLLAETIAAAEAHSLKGCASSVFRYTSVGGELKPTECCAIGGLATVKAGSPEKARSSDGDKSPYEHVRTLLNNEGLRRWDLAAIWHGNDEEAAWYGNRGDGGESFGWAFRNAMDPNLNAEA